MWYAVGYSDGTYAWNSKPENTRIKWHRGAFLEPFLPCKSSEYYIFWVFVRSLRYPACNAHAPYCHLWLAALYFIILHYLKKGTILKKKVFIIKCVYRVPLQILSEKVFILRRTERDMINNVPWSSCEVPLFLSDFNETWIFSTDFRKILKYQISSG